MSRSTSSLRGKIPRTIHFPLNYARAAALSATVRTAGFMTLPTDCDRNKRSLRVKTISLDLTKPESWTTLRYIIRNCNVASVHVAPPCGTCSRAREKRLNDQQHGPRPLRNERFPYGTPGLRLHEEVRVKAANSLYMHMSKFCLWLIKMKVPFTIENPTNSWLWKLPCMKELVNKCYVSTFHSCA